ncbi:hypothetical protein DAPPUDRAFT_241333 [Daphnia pulex]|uniref:C1q domain-containing protein n=1 Tax=Daphnia pulex TaxID=6669 RepID=E9GE03_DAPPU|nr:hypothetical protein DAPPUDRAFT_241333 [Daphnia pulex]|eukprot:EFX82184.1 hypothetical protein DAPPUDRAFT_241333 [Daphnia pulex]
MEQLVAAKDSRLESLELKVQHQGILEAQMIILETQVNQMKAQAIGVQQQESMLPAKQSRDYSNASSLRQGTTKLPKSCVDLKVMGHTLSGIFLIKGVKTVETVFCDFSLAATNPNFQTWIGFNDIKSSPVSFHAQRENYKVDNAVNSAVNYSLVRLNVGNALNPSTGVFVAPKAGRYYFAFSGLGAFDSVKVQLQMKVGSTDWIKIGEAYGTAWNTMALQSTLQLTKGDQIRLFLLQGTIHDFDNNNFSNFVGYLIEEDVFDR